MADDVQDILICTSTDTGSDTGSEWTSLSELAAGVVDANLPIESVDGEVVLSDSSGSFVVSTGSEERVVVDKDGRLLVGKNAGENPNFNNHFRTTGNQQFVIESDTGQPQIKVKADDFWYYFSLSPADDVLRLVSYNGLTNASYNVFNALPDGSFVLLTGLKSPYIEGVNDNESRIRVTQNITFQTGLSKTQRCVMTPDVITFNNSTGGDSVEFSDASATFSIPVFANTVKGSDVNDASINFSENFVVSTNNKDQFTITKDNRFLFGENAGANTNFDYHFFKANGNSQLVLDCDNGSPMMKIKAGESFWYYFQLNNNDHKLRLVSYDNTKATSFNNMVCNTDGSTEFRKVNAVSVEGPSSDQSSNSGIRFAGQLRTFNHIPTEPDSVATKKTVDDKIVVCTSAEYAGISPKLPGTLYCLTD